MLVLSPTHTHTDALVEMPLMGQKVNSEKVFSESRPLALVVLAIPLFQIDISKSKCSQFQSDVTLSSSSSAPPLSNVLVKAA